MKIFGYEPAILVYSINSLVAVAVAYGLDLSQTQVAAISTIATAVLAGVVAVMTRPFVVSALTGAVGTVLTAMAGFGLDLSEHQIAATVTGLGVVLGLVLRANVTPAVKAKHAATGPHPL
ncbi:MAG TPA: hypothetical protein VIS29_18055 [Streptomyces sp.]|jgi:hypothetical protein